MIHTPAPTGFTNFATGADRASNKLSLESRLQDYDTMYRQSAPSPSGKGAPGINDQTKGPEGEGADFFGYGSQTIANPFGDQNSTVSNINATGSVKIKGFTTKKSAGNKKSDYGHGAPDPAADNSFNPNKMDTVMYSDYMSGFTGTQRDKDGGSTAGRSRSSVGGASTR